MKDKLIELLRSVPITDKPYPEYIEAVAERLIEADLCKASEVAAEIFVEIEQQLRGLFDFFRQDDCIRESSAIMLAISELAELKKKYMEDEE